jgi:hypothetical protein
MPAALDTAWGVCLESADKNYPCRDANVDWRAVGRRLRELRGFEVRQATLARELGVSQAQFVAL